MPGNGDSQAPPLTALIESLLFVAGEPTPVSRLARSLGTTEPVVEEALKVLADELRERGVRLQRLGRAVQMVSAPEAAPYIEQFLGLDKEQRLSLAALETLAIIAYQQPVSRAQIEATRGVNSERAIATLKLRGLVEEVGRGEGPGRPVLFGTTMRFLEYFGLEQLGDLPPINGDGSEGALA